MSTVLNKHIIRDPEAAWHAIREQLPPYPESDYYSVRTFERAVRYYLEGGSCAEAEVDTGVNAEVLRSYLHRARLIRSHREAATIKSLPDRLRARRMFRLRHRSSTVASVIGRDRTTVYAWRRQYDAGIPFYEWNSSKDR